MQFLLRSLGAKVMVLISVISIVVFSLMAVLNAWEQRSAMIDQLGAGITNTAMLMQRSISNPMVVGDDAGTKEEFKALGEEVDATTIYLTDFEGNITYSTELNSVRKDLSSVVQQQEIQQLVQSSLDRNVQDNLVTSLHETPVFVRATSITNNDACHHCHGASEPILGTMIVVRDISHEMGIIDSNVTHTIVLSVLGLIVLLTGIILFTRSSIIKRITHLAAASGKVTQGDFSQDFTVKGQDELFQLSQNLGLMVNDIKEKLGFSQGILNGLTLPCVVVDTNSDITFVNTHLLNLVDRTGAPQEYLGTSTGQLFYNDPNRQTMSAKAMREERAVETEMEFTTIAGNVKILNMTSTPIYDLDGNLQGSVALYYDLTTIRDQERTIAEKNTRMAEVASKAQEIAVQLAASSEELSHQVEEATNGATTQSQRTTETATAMEQMNAAVLEVAQNASRSAELADVARQKALEGEHVVEDVVTAIGDVAQEAESLKLAMDDLIVQAENIGEVMSVVNDIADQTNLLALNAAIEAARAGDAGRGFAVVADEVRKLAEKTMTATSQVGGAVGAIQSSVRSSRKGTESAVQAVVSSTTLARRSGDTLQEIVSLVEQSADEVRAIATASEEQSATSDEIARATDEINEISNQTSIIMSESSLAVAQVAELAGELRELIATMKD